MLATLCAVIHNEFESMKAAISGEELKPEVLRDASSYLDIKEQEKPVENESHDQPSDWMAGIVRQYGHNRRNSR